MAVAVVTSVVVALNLLPARAQQAAPAPVTITLNALAAIGQSVTNLSLGPQTLNVVITNNSPATLTAQQVVVRVPPAPSYIASASDGTTNAGVIDNRTGVWYHTIPQIAGGGTLTITVSWQALCPGLWPLVARVGDKVSAVKGIWVGSPNSACTPDDSAAPQPVSYYALPWPPTAASSTTTPSATASVPISVPIVGASTTVAPTPPVPSVTTPPPVPNASTSNPIAPVTSLISLGTTTTVLVTPVQPGAPTTNATGPTTPTTDGLTSLGSAKTTTTKKKATTKTTLIICRTIQGKRYCGASSSVYTAGQPKAKEISPKTAATKKK